MQVQKGRLDLRLDVDAWRQDLLDQGLVEIPVDGRIAVRAGLLPNMHGDPADRLIVATALVGGHQLVTADRRILEWPGPLRLGDVDSRASGNDGRGRYACSPPADIPSHPGSRLNM